MTTRFATGVALALFCMQATAEEPRIYGGFGIGEVILDGEIDGSDFKGDTFAFKMFGGYRFSKYGSLELAHLNAGQASDLRQRFTLASEVSAFQASAILQAPITARLEGFVRGSFFSWEATNRPATGMNIKQTEEGSGWGCGIGAAFRVAPRFIMRAEFENADLSGTEMKAWMLSTITTF
jgi:opacity protein-like surface antigen